MADKRLSQFDGLRAYAILVIIRSHTHAFHGGGGGTMVALFLALSGFFAARPFTNSNFESAYLRPRKWISFYLLRIARIIPALWAVLVLTYLAKLFVDEQGLRYLGENMLLIKSDSHFWYAQNQMVIYLFEPALMLFAFMIRELLKFPAKLGRNLHGKKNIVDMHHKKNADEVNDADIINDINIVNGIHDVSVDHDVNDPGRAMEKSKFEWYHIVTGIALIFFGFVVHHYFFRVSRLRLLGNGKRQQLRLGLFIIGLGFGNLAKAFNGNWRVGKIAGAWMDIAEGLLLFAGFFSSTYYLLAAGITEKKILLAGPIRNIVLRWRDFLCFCFILTGKDLLAGCCQEGFSARSGRPASACI